MPWRTRLAVLAAGYLTDATRRADGTVNRRADVTVNRRLLGVLDKGATASAAPRSGVASRDVIIDAAVPLRARLFHPAASGSQEEGRRPLPVVVFFHAAALVTAGTKGGPAPCATAAAAEAAAGSEKQSSSVRHCSGCAPPAWAPSSTPAGAAPSLRGSSSSGHRTTAD